MDVFLQNVCLKAFLSLTEYICSDKSIVGCKITKTVLAADPADMRRHIEGKKFKKKLEWRKKRGQKDAIGVIVIG